VRLVQACDGNSTLVIDVDKCDPTPLFDKIRGSRIIAHNANFKELWLHEYFGVDLGGL